MITMLEFFAGLSAFVVLFGLGLDLVCTVCEGMFNEWFTTGFCIYDRALYFIVPSCDGLIYNGVWNIHSLKVLPGGRLLTGFFFVFFWPWSPFTGLFVQFTIRSIRPMAGLSIGPMRRWLGIVPRLPMARFCSSDKVSGRALWMSHASRARFRWADVA